MEDRIGWVYYLRNTINGKGYVGKTFACKPEARWARHIRESEACGGKAIHKAIRKYGVVNFTAEVVWQGPVSKLSAAEARFVKKYATFSGYGTGYNMTHGGDGSYGYTPTEQTKRKMRAAAKIRWSKPEEREKLAAANRGKVYSAERRAAISVKSMGHTISAAGRASISAARCGKPLSAEHCAKLKAARLAYLERQRANVQ